MVPITKLMRQSKDFIWTRDCQVAFEDIKSRYINAPLLIVAHWYKEFHVHTLASNLAVAAMLAQNLTRKCDHPIAWTSQLLNKIYGII